MLSFLCATLIFLARTGVCTDDDDPPEPPNREDGKLTLDAKFQGLSDAEIWKLKSAQQKELIQWLLLKEQDVPSNYRLLSTEDMLAELGKEQSEFEKMMEDERRRNEQEREDRRHQAQALEKDLHQKVEESDHLALVISLVGGVVFMVIGITIAVWYTRRKRMKNARAAARAKAPTVGIVRHTVCNSGQESV